MTVQLLKRIDELKTEIASSDPDIKAEALEHLEQVIQQLEDKGVVVPDWAASKATELADDGEDDAFDNMPV